MKSNRTFDLLIRIYKKTDQLQGSSPKFPLVPGIFGIYVRCNRMNDRLNFLIFCLQSHNLLWFVLQSNERILFQINI